MNGYVNSISQNLINPVLGLVFMEKIPFMHDPLLRQAYSEYLSEKLMGSRLKVIPSTRVVGLLVYDGVSKDFEGVLRTYVLGSNTNHVERRGLGMILTSDDSTMGEWFVRSRGFERLGHHNHILKQLDTTGQVLEELSAFEKRIYG